MKLDEMVGDPAFRRTHTVDEWLPERAAVDAVATLGADVRLASTRALDTAALIGRVTSYEFADVRGLTLEMLPVLPADGGSSSSARFVGDRHFTFDLLDESDRRVLVARFPDAQIEHSGPDTSDAAAEQDPAQEALLRAFVGGGRLEIAIEPELTIVRTNTPHRTGQRVTLLAIDAERVLRDEETSQRLRLRPASLDELRYQLHDAPGVIVSVDREIRIELAGR